MLFAVHTGEEHVLLIDIIRLVALNLVAVRFVGVLLFFPLIYGSALLADRHAVVAVGFEQDLTCVGLSIEQWSVAILFTAQVGSQGEDILWRVLVHRRISRAADDDDGIRTVAYHYHEHAEERGVHQSCGDHILSVTLPLHSKVKQGEHDYTTKDALPAIAVEGDTQHAHTQQVGERHTRTALLFDGFPDAPKHNANEQGDIDDDACVERHVEGVDEEEFEPSANLYDAGNDAVQDSCDEQSASCQPQKCALQSGILNLSVVEYEHESRQAEQVQQVNADAQASQVGDEDEPAVASRLVCMVFPLEHQPEDDSREEATVGIHLAFYCAEPEGVAEGIDQRTCQCTCLDRDELSQVLHFSVLANQLACQMADAPEEEHDTCGAEERTHHVDHQRNLRRVAYKLRE